MHNDALIAEIARQEILAPTLGTSHQALAVHRPKLEQGLPKITYIDTLRETDTAFVYFPLEGVPYFFVVVIRAGIQSLAVSSSYFEAAVDISLVVRSTVLELSDITDRLGIQPTEIRQKGQPVRQNSRRTYARNIWRFEPDRTIPDDIDRKLRRLIEQLIPVSAGIAGLAQEQDENTQIAIEISYDGQKDQMGGWHLNPQDIQMVASLGIGIDLDLYAHGPDIPLLD